MTGLIRSVLVAAVAVALVLYLINDDQDATRQGTRSLDYYLSGLKVPDPTAPGSSLAVDPAVAVDPDGKGTQAVPVIPLLRGSWANGGVKRVAVDGVVYARTDGSLQRAPARGGVYSDGSMRAPQPQQLVGPAGAYPLCGAQVAHDLAHPRNTRLAYQVSGPDGRCDSTGKQSWRLIKVDPRSLARPMAFPGQPVVSLHDPGEGSHTGWLARRGNQLLALGADLDRERPVGVVAGYVEPLAVLRDGNVLLNLDGSLVAYQPSSGELVASYYRFPADRDGSHRPLEAASDGRSLFFLVSDLASGASLYRADAAGAVTRLHAPPDSPSGSFAAGQLVLTEDRAAYVYRTGDGSSRLISVRKDGSAVTEIDRHALPDGIGLALADLDGIAHPDRIFYSRRNGTGSADALVSSDDGEQHTGWSNALWVGYSLAPSLVAPGLWNGVERVFLADGVQRTGQLGGARLAGLQATAPHAAASILGTIPADVEGFTVPGGLGPGRLAKALTRHGGKSHSDVFYLSREQRLTRVTHTAQEDELPVPLF